MPVSYLPVSWNEYHSLAQSLAAKILNSKQTYDEIVAIARGGLTLGHLLSDLLQIPVSTIAIQSYVDIQTQGDLKITGKLQSPINGKRILLVDDVADSGKTLVRAKKYLSRFHPSAIAAATLFYKPRSIFKPNYIAATTQKWILFPYEPTEMILAITKQAESARFFKKLGFTDAQIAFVRKYHFHDPHC